MKRPLQLSLAITLALAGTNAIALGLGPVRVMSKLNQPLQAEIPVIQGSAGEAEGLLVSLADQEDFERLGISRSHLGVPLEFSVAKDAKGQVVIRVTSTEPVRSTYLDFLVEANWPKGRMLREYTVLLDPPMTAPVAAPTPKAVAAAPAMPKPAKPSTSSSKPAAAAPVAAPHRPAAAAPAPARAMAAGDYGPTQAGETLSSVAAKMRGGDADLNQMMLALLKHNPDAFYRDNINALKRGVILRAPSEDEIKAIGAASEAARQVHAQIEDWRGMTASTPRVAADTAATAPAPKASKPVASASPKPAASSGPRDQLELVPPKAGTGKDSGAVAGSPASGSSNGSGRNAASAESARELARTKEALATSEQAASDLKSRVKDLEDLKAKNDRLISLKDSEIADLQKKLKELQAAKPTPGAAKPVAEAAPASAPIDKKDIWGDSAKANADSAPKATAESHPATPVVDAKSSAATPPAPAIVDANKPTAPAAPADGKAATASTMPAAPAPGDVVPGKATTSPLADTGTTSTTTAPAAATATTPAAAPTTAKPAATTTPKPATPAPAKPAASAPKAATQHAWYEADWVMPAAIGGGVLVLLLGFLGLRKRKPAAKKTSAAAAPSIADSFGDSYAHGGSGNVMESEIAHLQGQIAADPGNLGAHLELLSIYYAERNVERFEEGAERMHEYVADPQQSEWQEVQAMGEELAPHHPLWASSAPDASSAHDDQAGNAQHFAYDDASFVDQDAPASRDDSFVPDAGRPDFGFGMPPAHAPEAAAPRDLADHGFGFDAIPPLEDIPVASHPEPEQPAMAHVSEPAPVPADDFFSNEDAVGTKLDLAKAYMDMGDPDGARSMLEEVLAEGNDAQRGEAQRLIADLR
ncbi:FimV/HubP family polar landmark protein [Dokdonella sp.]|uniref:FimV/HubP family polar landmark protein n=1 Tax=Dokdonella sp. TaxID=2291710 RepID=UPI0025C5A166|nr:FimV/HubP family polar landmark protein [Dokdonella sp.]MBX3689029.1 hypothetical protein [Dokdonella sp.]